jgi:hypothetical protein
MADQCCCGRIKPAPSEPERINDIVHEAYGTEGAFCGPWWKHELRDLRTALTAMERERDEARARVVAMREAMEKAISDACIAYQACVGCSPRPRDEVIAKSKQARDRLVGVLQPVLADTGDMVVISKDEYDALKAGRVPVRSVPRQPFVIDDE